MPDVLTPPTATASQRPNWPTEPPRCPDFIIGLRSRTDRLATWQTKREEYCPHGDRLGWLIDPLKKQVHIYRAAMEPKILESPLTVNDTPVLADFLLNLTRIWQAS